MFAIPVQQLNTSFFISFCFFTCIFIVWRRFECTYRQLSPYMFIPPLYLFPNPPLLPHFWKNLFGNIVPMKYGINTKIDSCGKIVSLCLEEVYKTTLQPLFISNTFISDTRLRFDLKNWQWQMIFQKSQLIINKGGSHTMISIYLFRKRKPIYSFSSLWRSISWNVASLNTSVVDMVNSLQYEYLTHFKPLVCFYVFSGDIERTSGMKQVKDIINPYNCFLKNASFSVKASNE